MSVLSRRSFVSRASQSSLGLAGLTILANPQSVRAALANERLVLAMIGVGGGRGHSLALGFLERDDCEIAYICDVDRRLHEPRAETYAVRQRGKRPKCVQDFREMLTDTAVDAAIIATPPHWHALATILCCRAGKDVYCEKPQSHNCWEGRQAVRAARKYNRIVQIGTQNRSVPYNWAAKRYIEEGKLGRIHLCRVHEQRYESKFQWAPDSDPPDTLNWDMWNGPAPQRKYNTALHTQWRKLWDYSGGQMSYQGIHQIDLARWLCGVDYPSSVYSVGGVFNTQGALETPDTQVATFEFPNLLMTYDQTLYTPYMLESDDGIRNGDVRWGIQGSFTVANDSQALRRYIMRRLPETLFVFVAATVVVAAPTRGAELYVGVSEADITHTQPMALWGQMHTRISKSVESPVTAHVVALESREGDRALDAAIMVSADIIGLPHEVLVALRKRVAERLPEFDVQKLFVSGTHTHTGPVFREGDYKVPKDGVVQPAEYAKFFVERVSEAAAKAWQERQKGAVAWGLGHAVVGQNRRAVYADGRAVMYGRTDQPDFRGFEGYEDHAVEVLFFFDREEKLLAAAINLVCTAQEVEGRSAVNADFFHEVREALREKHGRELKILGWIGAAGDQSPHLMFRQRAEDRMRELRGLTRLQEIARRIVAAFDEAYEGARQEIRSDAVLAHRLARLDLPVRLVTDEEAAAAKAKVEALSKDPANQTLVGWHRRIVDRHANQKGHPTHEVEIHVLRLGDVAIATNPFELFVDFGVQIKARSPALQTIVVQLVGVEGYLPTLRAVRGGGYSAIAESNTVGPEGGQVLADRTVELIKSLWPEPKR